MLELIFNVLFINTTVGTKETRASLMTYGHTYFMDGASLLY